MSRPQLSPMRRSRIQFLCEQGLSQSEIARQLKTSRSAVQYNLKKFQETFSYVDRPKSGRKKVTDERQDRQLIRASLRNRRLSSSELAAEFSQQHNVPISAQTVRRRLLEGGLRGCKARKKPWLSKKNQQSRYDWAKEHLSWTLDDWKKVVWSDECNVEVNG